MSLFDTQSGPLMRASDTTPLLVGDSDVIVQLRADIEIASRSDAKVMIAGETGVGKEVVAQLIHKAGNRQRQPFVAINCAGLPDSLLESELFGHVRGSFTGAYRDKPGLASQADRGTLFLDELGEMSARMQGVLLRFVETGEIHRLGADRMERRVDTRIIAATNRNLLERIATGDFREDLYYRLNVIHIAIPPLRDRGSDILRLFNHYLNHYSRQHRVEAPSLTPSTEELLLAYRWPGNVRELRNIVERVTVRNHRGGPIRPDMLPVEVRREASGRTSVPVAATPGSPAAAPAPPVAYHPAADAAWNDMVIDGKSFWVAVHPLFIERELTKSDVREIIRRGLKQTQGSYRKLIELFHLPASDYKRFLAFLYQHDCHLAFHPFREQRFAQPSQESAERHCLGAK
jgi:transcriptional regulator with PAS, ATPase and Fis domain